jgi:hypothetical protein
MACTCQESGKENREVILKLVETVDLRDVAEQATAIPETMTSAIRHLEKAERAERLGLGADVAALYRQAAERDRAQARRQFRAVIQRLDERTSRDDWGELADRIKREFEAQDGSALIEEAGGRFRLAVLEMDGVSADDAAETVALHDEALDHIRVDGVNGGTRFLKEHLEQGLQALQSPEMGRQRASPLTELTIVCISIIVALAAIALAVCGFLPFCWCCFGVALAIGTAVGVAACLLAEAIGV